MEVSKQQLLQKVSSIDKKVDQLLQEIKDKETKIRELEEQNDSLQANNRSTLDQIREYIQELEQIRSHYVDSKD